MTALVGAAARSNITRSRNGTDRVMAVLAAVAASKASFVTARG